MKKCQKCLKTKHESEFNKNKHHKDGLQSRCKPCDSEYAKVHYRRDKQKWVMKTAERKKALRLWLDEIKKKSKCIRCGESRWYVLDFHHKDPAIKDDTVCMLCAKGASRKRIKEEIDKCETLCANCHREFHHLQEKASMLMGIT